MAYDRRRFLRAAAVAAVAAGAGCSTSTDDGTTADGGAEGGGDGDGGTPTPGSMADTPTGTSMGSGRSFDYGDWFSETDNFDGTVDRRGQSEVTVDVGASGNGGAFAFAPAAVWVDPGTTVRWEWTGNGSHNVVAQSGADFRSGDATADGSTTFSHTFEGTGIVTYYCNPHQGLGMKGAVVVGDVGGDGGTGTATPGDGGSGTTYDFQAATFDAYWYSLYNMSTNIAMSGNGVLFPHNDQQQQAFDERFPKMLDAAGEERPPIKEPNLNMAAFTSGDPSFTQQPVLSGDDGRPAASTLQWDPEASSGVVSPSSLGWTHLKGVTWAKNFENHFDILPDSLAAEFRSMVLTTLAQIGINATLIAGGPEENGALTKGESLELVSGFRPATGEVVDNTARPRHHAAMLWFLSDMTSLAQGGWFGYENPEPLIPSEKIQQLTDGLAKTTMDLFSPADIVEMESTRGLGDTLGAIAWYGTHSGDAELEAQAATYADELAAEVEANLVSNGKVENGSDNQAATQGIVGQGLVWASELNGVDHTGIAEDVLGYLLEDLWDDEAGVYKSGESDTIYTITARDAGDITGGINAADAVLGLDVQENYARFFNQTFNRGRLQRAERPQSRDENAEFTLPSPPAAGGEFGQAAVYNAEVEYDSKADEWSVTDDLFDTEGALYLANQDIWISHWGGEFYQGRGVPGRSDSPE